MSIYCASQSKAAISVKSAEGDLIYVMFCKKKKKNLNFYILPRNILIVRLNLILRNLHTN